jgi:hypothetical protein
MSARWSEIDLANHLAQRGCKLAPQNTSPKISREVKHDFKAEFEQQLSLVGIQVDREFYFARPRKWRSDWRVVGTLVLIEFEGGLFAKRAAGHSSVTGILRDIEKYNEATLAGWIVIRITPKHITSGQALKWVEQAIASNTHKEISLS